METFWEVTFRQLEISLRQLFTRARVFRMYMCTYTYGCTCTCKDTRGKKENVAAEWDMRNRFGRIFFDHGFNWINLIRLGKGIIMRIILNWNFNKESFPKEISLLIGSLLCLITAYYYCYFVRYIIYNKVI